MEKGTENQEPAFRSAAEDLLGGLVDSSTLVELETIEKSKVPGKTEKDPPEKKVETKDPNENQEEVEAEEEEQEEEEEENDDPENKTDKKDKKEKKDKDQPEVADNKFGIKLGKKEDKKPGAKIDIKSFDELPGVLEKKYGQKIKDVKDLPKFFEVADKWRADSQNLEKVTKEKDNMLATWQGLPPDIIEAAQLHYKGEDYKKAFDSGPKLDFTKPVEKQDTKKLVEAFFPGEFKDEDFDADEKSRDLKIAIKASEKEFNSQKTTREERAKAQVEKAKRQNEAYKTSVSSSVKILETAFPEMGQDVKADIEQTLSSGQLMGVFFNPDGTYKPQAAKMLMLAQHGEEFIGQLMEIAQKRGESAANEDIVERGADKAKNKSGKKPDVLRKEVAEKVNELLPQGLLNKKVF